MNCFINVEWRNIVHSRTWPYFQIYETEFFSFHSYEPFLSRIHYITLYNTKYSEFDGIALPIPNFIDRKINCSYKKNVYNNNPIIRIEVWIEQITHYRNWKDHVMSRIMNFKNFSIAFKKKEIMYLNIFSEHVVFPGEDFQIHLFI